MHTLNGNEVVIQQKARLYQGSGFIGNKIIGGCMRKE